MVWRCCACDSEVMGAGGSCPKCQPDNFARKAIAEVKRGRRCAARWKRLAAAMRRRWIEAEEDTDMEADLVDRLRAELEAERREVRRLRDLLDRANEGLLSHEVIRDAHLMPEIARLRKRVSELEAEAFRRSWD